MSPSGWVIMVLIAYSISVTTVAMLAIGEVKTDAIEQGCAQHNPKTGNFEWLERERGD